MVLKQQRSEYLISSKHRADQVRMGRSWRFATAQASSQSELVVEHTANWSLSLGHRVHLDHKDHSWLVIAAQASSQSEPVQGHSSIDTGLLILYHRSSLRDDPDHKARSWRTAIVQGSSQIE